MGLFAGRISTAVLRSNQIRLYFSSMAYCVVEALRRLGLAGTKMAGGNALAGLFEQVYENLQRRPPLRC